MEYKEELVHNAPAIAWNTIISVAKKVEDNVLHVMTALVTTLQPTVLQDPAANPTCMPCLRHQMTLSLSRYVCL